MEKSIVKLIDLLFTPLGILMGIVLMFGVYVLMRFFGADASDYIAGLSMLALTLSQMIGVSSKHGDKATQTKLDEMIHATDKADDNVAGIEKE